MAENTRLRISPYARKTARELGVDPANLTGTGPGGRIIRRDVDSAAAKAKATGHPPVQSGYETTANIEELLAALDSLNGALDFQGFAQMAAGRLNTPLRCAGPSIRRMIPALKPGEDAVLAAGAPADGKVRLYLAYNAGALGDGAAADRLRAMRAALENPLSMLL